MPCKDCNHDEHKAGFCEKCNCGESEVIYPTHDHSHDEDFYVPDYLSD